ncbi:MAG: hypothetical protein ABJG78_10545 [Cyclobacteriaceae bacterium]
MKEFLRYVVPYLLLIVVIFVLRASEVNFAWGLPLTFSICALYFFHLDNPYKKHLTSISILFILWIIVFHLTLAFNLSSRYANSLFTLLTVVYIFRFSLREDKLIVDYLKIFTLVALGIAFVEKPEFVPLVLPTVAFSYLLDRLIIRRKMSKTLQIIAFSLMGLASITFMVYGFIKAKEAEQHLVVAEEAQATAEEQAANAARHFQSQAELVADLQKELAQCKAK